MSKLSNVAKKFGMSEDELGYRVGYDQRDMKKILEPDAVISPGEIREMISKLSVLSMRIKDRDIRNALQRNTERREYLDHLRIEHGIDMEPFEDPYTF